MPARQSSIYNYYKMPSKNSPISRLPVEVPGIVFNKMYFSSKSLRHSVPTEELRWLKEDPHTPNLFPMPLASVCCGWRNVARSYPHFWTRLVFKMDDEIPLPLDAFNWSRTSRIDVLFLTYNEGDDGGIDGNRKDKDAKIRERNWLTSMASLLTPHLHRCNSVQFHTKFSSSLPYPTFFFTKAVPYIQSILLDCEVDDGLPINTPLTEPGTPLSTDFSRLRHLMLPCRFFIEMWTHHNKWLSECAMFDDLSLTLTRYRFHTVYEGNQSRFDTLLRQVIGSLGPDGNIYALHFKHLSLAYHQSSWFEDRGSLGISKVSFENVDSHLIALFFVLSAGTYFKSVTFDRCELTSVTTPDCYSLKIKNIEDDFSLYQALDGWHGPLLKFEKCPALDDALLRWLSEAGTRVQLEPLRELKIKDCSNFTFEGLHRWLRTRYFDDTDEEIPDEKTLLGEWDTDYVVPIHDLSVVGCVPELSKGQRKEYLERPFARAIWWDAGTSAEGPFAA